MDESPADELLLSAQSQNNNNNNKHNGDEKSENVDDQNANALVNIPIAHQTELLDVDSSDLDYDSLEGDDDNRSEIETMLLKAMDSHAYENSTTNPDVRVADSHTIDDVDDDDNDFKHSIDNNNIPTTSNDIKQIESQTNGTMCQAKPSDNNNHKQNTENNASINDVNNDSYDSAEEGEPIFDFLGKANEIVCYLCSSTHFQI